MELFKNLVLLSFFVIGVVGITKGQKMGTPALLKADNKVIDMKPAYTAPTFLDYDGDGLKDMIVGTYMGNFRFYKNRGTKNSPLYKDYKLILAEGKEAKIPNW